MPEEHICAIGPGRRRWVSFQLKRYTSEWTHFSRNGATPNTGRRIQGRNIKVCPLSRPRVCSPRDRGRSSLQQRREAGSERSAFRRARGVQWKMEISCTFFEETSDCSERADPHRISMVSTNSESQAQPRCHNQSVLPTSAKPNASKWPGRRAEPGVALLAQNPTQPMPALREEV